MRFSIRGCFGEVHGLNITGGLTLDEVLGILWRVYWGVYWKGFWKVILGRDSGKGYREGRFVRSLNAASGRISKSLNLKEISEGFNIP